MPRLSRPLSALALMTAGVALAVPVAHAGELTFTCHKVMDKQFSGRVAISALVPTGWTVKDQLVWELSDPDVPLRYSGRFADPNGLAAVEFYPDAAAAHSVGPTGASGPKPPRGILAGLKVGIEKHRPGVRYRVVEEKATVVERMNTRPAAGQTVSGTVEAGYVRIRYDLNGRAVEEEFCGSLSVVHLVTVGVVRTEALLWRGSNLCSIRAEAGRLAAAKKQAHVIIGSARMDLAFYNLFVQVKDQVVAAGWEAIRQTGIRSRIIAGANAQISQTITSSYWDTQRRTEKRHEAFSDYMRGVEPYRAGGQVVKLPSGFTSAWANDRGEYVLSDRSGFDPNATLRGNWTPLPRAR